MKDNLVLKLLEDCCMRKQKLEFGELNVVIFPKCARWKSFV